MTTLTSKLGADMDDPEMNTLVIQTATAAGLRVNVDGKMLNDNYTNVMGSFPSLVRFARALLARQPAAIGKEAVAATVYVDCHECAECGHIGINDSHDTDASCGYSCGWTGPSPVEDKCPGCQREGVMGLACPKCSGRYSTIAEARIPAAPLANEASKPAAQQTLSDGAQFFACYLIDNCENEVVREESVQAWLGKMLASPRYHPAAPSVEQDERGAHLQLLDEVLEAKSVMLAAGCKQATFGEMFAEYARAASTSANVAQGATGYRGACEHTTASIPCRICRTQTANMTQGAEEPDCWAILTPNGSRLVSPDEAKGRLDAYPLYTAPPAQTALRRIAHELRTYNPAADEYKGEHIHKVWAREIEALLTAASNGESK